MRRLHYDKQFYSTILLNDNLMHTIHQQLQSNVDFAVWDGPRQRDSRCHAGKNPWLYPLVHADVGFRLEHLF